MCYLKNVIPEYFNLKEDQTESILRLNFKLSKTITLTWISHRNKCNNPIYQKINCLIQVMSKYRKHPSLSLHNFILAADLSKLTKIKRDDKYTEKFSESTDWPTFSQVPPLAAEMFLELVWPKCWALFLFFSFLTSLLEYNCFTMVCQFLLYNKVNQLYVYIYSFSGSFPLQVIIKY